MRRIAVMGDQDSIYGFAALGMEPFPVTNPQEGAKKLRELAESDYAIIYVTEALGAQIEKEIDSYRSSELPAIILIPGVSGNTGRGMDAVRKSVIKAVGSDIVFNNN